MKQPHVLVREHDSVAQAAEKWRDACDETFVGRHPNVEVARLAAAIDALRGRVGK